MKKLTEERILQMSNDLSEGDCDYGTVKEWQAVVLYFRNAYDRELRKTSNFVHLASLLIIGTELSAAAVKDLKRLAEKHRDGRKSEIPRKAARNQGA